MYKILYMKADFEPWWQFEGWESFIVSTYLFETKKEFDDGLESILTSFRERYEHEEHRKDKFIAFWNEQECEYCEGCDEDAQVYHGLIIDKPN